MTGMTHKSHAYPWEIWCFYSSLGCLAHQESMEANLTNTG